MHGEARCAESGWRHREQMGWSSFAKQGGLPGGTPKAVLFIDHHQPSRMRTARVFDKAWVPTAASKTDRWPDPAAVPGGAAARCGAGEQGRADVIWGSHSPAAGVLLGQHPRWEAIRAPWATRSMR